MAATVAHKIRLHCLLSEFFYTRLYENIDENKKTRGAVQLPQLGCVSVGVFVCRSVKVNCNKFSTKNVYSHLERNVIEST